MCPMWSCAYPRAKVLRRVRHQSYARLEGRPGPAEEEREAMSAIDFYVWLRQEFGEGVAVLYAQAHLAEIVSEFQARWAKKKEKS